VLRTYIGSSRERTDREALVSGLFILADEALQLDRFDGAFATAREDLALVEEHQFWPFAESAGVDARPADPTQSPVRLVKLPGPVVGPPTSTAFNHGRCGRGSGYCVPSARRFRSRPTGLEWAALGEVTVVLAGQRRQRVQPPVCGGSCSGIAPSREPIRINQRAAVTLEISRAPRASACLIAS
jgi:hypothetical protein